MLGLLTYGHELLTLAPYFHFCWMPVQRGLLSPVAVQVLSILQHPAYSWLSLTRKAFLIAWICTGLSFLNSAVGLVFPTYIGTQLPSTL